MSRSLPIGWERATLGELCGRPMYGPLGQATKQVDCAFCEPRISVMAQLTGRQSRSVTRSRQILPSTGYTLVTSSSHVPGPSASVHSSRSAHLRCSHLT